jgi:hypothetical protein
LYKIRKYLGFGRVASFIKNGNTYWQYYTSDKSNIERFIQLFNGNLVLEKRRSQFESLLQFFNKTYRKHIVQKPWIGEPSLSHAWLTGFLEADGGFYTNVQQQFRKGKKIATGEPYYNFHLKMYITQKGERNALEKIRNLFGGTAKIATITNGKTPVLYQRLEIFPASCRERIIEYVTKFPFLGEINISYKQWVRVHGYKQRGLKLSDKSALKLSNLVLKLADPNFVGDDPALVQEILENPGS